MNEIYKQYLINKWKEAEEIAKDIGCTDNKVVCTIFKMIAQPFYYWHEAEKYGKNKK